jgi:hypothetical protein
MFVAKLGVVKQIGSNMGKYNLNLAICFICFILHYYFGEMDPFCLTIFKYNGHSVKNVFVYNEYITNNLKLK